MYSDKRLAGQSLDSADDIAATFDPMVASLGNVGVPANLNDLLLEEQEHMLYSAGWTWGYNHGGPLTKRVMDKLSNHRHNYFNDKYHFVIDTKMVMLMPGQYPCIPGWHCDAVKRSTRDAQPNLSTMDNKQFHFVCIISNAGEAGSFTKFITNSLTIPYDRLRVWESVSKNIESIKESPLILTRRATNGELLVFNSGTLHKGSPATKREWRYFFRMSMYHNPPENKMRRQVQVYTTKDGGW